MKNELPMLVLNRNYTLNSLYGHSIRFEKGVPTKVPPSVYNEAVAIGATPADGTDPDVLQDVPQKVTVQDPAERAQLILDAVNKLAETNNRKDFTAAGSPTVKAVEKITEFDVDAREIAAAWQTRHDNLAAENG